MFCSEYNLPASGTVYLLKKSDTMLNRANVSEKTAFGFIRVDITREKETRPIINIPKSTVEIEKPPLDEAISIISPNLYPNKSDPSKREVVAKYFIRINCARTEQTTSKPDTIFASGL